MPALTLFPGGHANSRARACAKRWRHWARAATAAADDANRNLADVLEPHIRDAPPVATQVVKVHKSVEVLHDDCTHRCRFCEP